MVGVADGGVTTRKGVAEVMEGHGRLSRWLLAWLLGLLLAPPLAGCRKTTVGRVERLI